MIRCSNTDCHLGAWFHLDCAGVDNIPDGDWWCCSKCQDTGSSVFCVCNKVGDGEQVTCANVNCSNGTTFHLRCVNLQQQPGRPIVRCQVTLVLYLRTLKYVAKLACIL